MFDIQREKLNWGGRELVLETGRIARQADGAVFASWGETTVLATVVAAKTRQARARTSSRSPSTIRKRPSPPAAFPAASSSAKGASPTRRR